MIPGGPSGLRSCLGAISRLGRLLGRLVLSNGLFLILKAELKLFNRQLLGASTELMAVRRSLSSRSLSFSAYKSRSICCSTTGSFGNASVSICTSQS